MDLIREVDDILETHHAPAKAAMPRLTAALAGAPVGLRKDWAALQAILTDHLAKEEVMLFPAVQALGRGDESVGHHVLGPIAQMHLEHEQLSELEARLRGQLDDAGDAREELRAFLDDLEVHARREDTGLFPHALAAVTGQRPEDIDLDELVAGITGRDGTPVAPRRAAPPPPGPKRRPSLLKRVIRRLFSGS